MALLSASVGVSWTSIECKNMSKIVAQVIRCHLSPRIRSLSNLGRTKNRFVWLEEVSYQILFSHFNVIVNQRVLRICIMSNTEKPFKRVFCSLWIGSWYWILLLLLVLSYLLSMYLNVQRRFASQCLGVSRLCGLQVVMANFDVRDDKKKDWLMLLLVVVIVMV